MADRASSKGGGAGEGARHQAVTRREVAELAGVAPSTVSLVLNNNPGTRIAAGTRERVLAAARQLGYHPSAVASALATGRTRNIGVVIHFTEMPFTGYVSDILNGAWPLAVRDGLRLLMSEGQPDASLAGIYRERAVDGILTSVIPRAAHDPELERVVKTGFPLVYVGARPDRLAADYVDIDNLRAGYTVTRALLAAGHRRILHIAGPTGLISSARDRQYGYEQALREAGIAPDPALVVAGSYNPAIAGPALRETLARGQQFSAIFAANYAMALAAVDELRRVGRRVPEDVAITAIDRRPEGVGAKGTEIYCLEQPCWAIGAKAIELLQTRISGRYAGPPREVFLPWTVNPGHSIAPPSR